MTMQRIAQQRAIIDRRALAERIVALVDERGGAGARLAVVELLRVALADGRVEIARRLAAKPSAGCGR